MALTPSRNAPPGPSGYPLIGVFPMARRDPPGFFLECARRYGDVVRMRLGTHRAYLLSHPADVQRVLQDGGGAWAKGPPAVRVDALFGGSLTAIDGEQWRRRRRVVQPAVPLGQSAVLMTAVTRASAEMLDRWRPLEQRGEPVDVVREMRTLSQAVVLRTVFGELPGEDIRAISDALDVIVARVERRLWSPLGGLRLPTPAAARYQVALGVVREFVARRVSEARRDNSSSGTMLAPLLERLGDGELHDELKGFLVAGHTTTASALAWIWYTLSEHPEVRARVAHESRNVLAGRAPDSGDLPRLGYTRRVIDEVLRLYPPTWLTARTALEGGEVGAYHIPAGALILLSPYVTHRHPAIWKAPERFEPDRFAPEHGGGRPPFSYFPFGGGPRRCVGSGLAITELMCVVATIAQRYRLRLVPGARVRPSAGLTLRPRSAVPMLIEPAS